MINIRNEREVISTGPIDIKRVIKEYLKQLYAYKFNLRPNGLIL